MSYTKIVPVTQPFYRSANNIEDLSGYWFGFTPNDTYGYGNITAEFYPTRQLRLLDITSHEFYNDLIKKLVEDSKVDSSIDARKYMLIFPLGYINMNIYLKLCDILGIPGTDSSNIEVEIATQFFGNRSRYSIKDIDIAFLTYIKQKYPYHNGIISEIKLPNIRANGFQHAELAIFNLNLMSSPKIIPRNIITGGALNKVLTAINIKHPLIEETKKAVDNFIKNNSSNINAHPKILSGIDIKVPTLEIFSPKNSESFLNKNKRRQNYKRYTIKNRK